MDETYERILKEIKPHQGCVHCLLQCLVVAIRPLHVGELAEVLANDFDVEGVPTLNPSWGWEDQEQALPSSRSSLSTIVNTDNSRVVQISHHLVKEFLTSPRLVAPAACATIMGCIRGVALSTRQPRCETIICIHGGPCTSKRAMDCLINQFQSALRYLGDVLISSSRSMSTS
jgi:hypothetical protein